jgi:hypothetical protein
LIVTDVGSANDVVNQLVAQGNRLTVGGIAGDYDRPYVLAQYIDEGTARRPLTELGPARIWIGLKYSDDVGIAFDLRVDLYLDAVLVGSGQLNSLAGAAADSRMPI